MEASVSRGSQQVSQQAAPQNVNRRTTQASMFPKKDLAILLTVSGDLKLADYVIAIANIVSPKNITHASRISNNRICIYLSDIHHVDFIIENHSLININGYDINVRRLITPARRLIISNVCPSIPDKIIETTVKNLGLQPVSTVTNMRAGLIGDEFNHILSFRRQIYVQPDESLEIPASVIIKYEDTNYRIYFTYDSLTCFTCKQAGHIARQCPNSMTDISDNQSKSQETSPESDNPVLPPIQHTEKLPETTDLLEPTDLLGPTDLLIPQLVENLTQHSTKRRAPSTSHSSSIELTEMTENSEFLTPMPIRQKTSCSEDNKTKKLKKSDSVESIDSIETLMRPLKQTMEDQPSLFTLTFDKLVDFLENIHGSPDVISIAQLYTSDFKGLIDTLDNIYPFLQHRTLKSRCTRVKKKLHAYLDLADSDASEMSQSGL